MNLHAQMINKIASTELSIVKSSPYHDRDTFLRNNQQLVNIHTSLMRDSAEVASSLNMYYHVSRYMACGCKDYLVMPTISKMLDDASLATDPRMLRAPFPSYSIEPPAGFGSLLNEITGEHQLWLFYVTMDKREDHIEVRIMVIGKKNKRSKHALDDSAYYFTIPVYLDRTIEESFTKQFSNMKSSIDSLHDGEKAEAMHINLKSAKRYLAYCINTTLYAISSNADSRWRSLYPEAVQKKIDSLKDQKRINRLRKINKDKLVRKCVLGSSVTPSAPSRSTEKRWELQKRVHVRGHFHGYWYKTEEGKELRPKWLEPYWKGPEKADQVHTQFEVND